MTAAACGLSITTPTEPTVTVVGDTTFLELPVGSSVRIGAAPRPARFVRREDAPAFFELVRSKFGLPGRDGEREGKS